MSPPPTGNVWRETLVQPNFVSCKKKIIGDSDLVYVSRRKFLLLVYFEKTFKADNKAISCINSKLVI